MSPEEKLSTYAKLVYDRLNYKVIGKPACGGRDIITSIKISDIITADTNMYKYINLIFNFSYKKPYVVGFLIIRSSDDVVCGDDFDEYISQYILETLKSENLIYEIDKDTGFIHIH